MYVVRVVSGEDENSILATVTRMAPFNIGDFVKGDAASKGVRWKKWTALLNDNFEWFGHYSANHYRK